MNNQTDRVEELLVRTENPEALDSTVQHFGAAVLGGGTTRGYATEDGAYVVRCFGDAEFVAFAIRHQGYGTVVGRRTVFEEGSDD